MTPVAIRPATSADIPTITRIYGHAVEHGTASFEIEVPDQTEMTRRQRELIDAGFPYIAAEFDGRLLGYAYAGPYRRTTGLSFHYRRLDLRRFQGAAPWRWQDAA